MKVDLLLVPFGTSWHAILAKAEAAESLGFDGLWTWDHLAGEVHRSDHVLESWTLLSALAARTSQVTIGPLVLNAANRIPGVLAVMAATLQEVAGGRLILGIGAGGGRDTPYALEQTAIGAIVADDRERRQRVADTIAICRQVWTGQTVATELATQRLGAARGFLRPEPVPPIVVGGFGPAMAELAGSIADGFNTQAAHPRLDELIRIARTAHQGRDGEFHVSGFAGLDPQSAQRAAGRLDRLIMIVNPDDDISTISAVASALGLG